MLFAPAVLWWMFVVAIVLLIETANLFSGFDRSTLRFLRMCALIAMALPFVVLAIFFSIVAMTSDVS